MYDKIASYLLPAFSRLLNAQRQSELSKEERGHLEKLEELALTALKPNGGVGGLILYLSENFKPENVAQLDITEDFIEALKKFLKDNLESYCTEWKLEKDSAEELKNAETIVEIASWIEKFAEPEVVKKKAEQKQQADNLISQLQQAAQPSGQQNQAQQDMASWLQEPVILPSGSSSVAPTKTLIKQLSEYQEKYGWQPDSAVAKEVSNYLGTKLAAYIKNILQVAGINLTEEQVLEFNEVKSYTDLQNKYKDFINNADEGRQKSAKEEFAKFENWLFFNEELVPVEREEEGLSEIEKEQRDEKLIVKILLENHLEGSFEAGEKARFNKRLVLWLSEIKDSFKPPLGYRLRWLRRFFGFGKQYEEVINTLDTYINKIKTLSTPESYLNILWQLNKDLRNFSRQEGFLDLPAVKALYRIQVTIDHFLKNNLSRKNAHFQLTPEQSRQATAYKSYLFFEQTKASLEEFAEAANWPRGLSWLFDSKAAGRNKLIESITAKLDKLTQLPPNPEALKSLGSKDSSTFRSDFITYLESLRAAIVELAKEQKPARWQRELKAKLEQQLQSAVSEIVLTKNKAGQSNYQAQFGIEIASCIYPICELALGKEHSFTKGLKEENPLYSDVLDTFVNSYDNALAVQKDSSFIEEYIRKNCLEDQNIADDSSVQINPKLKAFQRAVFESFSALGYTSLISPEVKTKENSQQEQDAAVIQTVADLMGRLPKVGGYLSKLIGVGADHLAKKGSEQRAAMYKAGRGALRLSDIEKVGTYVAEKLTQMLEFQVQQLTDESIQKLALLLVRRMFIALACSNNLNLQEHFADANASNLGMKLCEAVFLIKLEQGTLGMQQPLCVDNEKGIASLFGSWTLEEMLKTGIVDTQDKHYEGVSSEPGKYGYIRGTSELAGKLKYSPQEDGDVVEIKRELAKQNQYSYNLSFNGLTEQENDDMVEKAIIAEQAKKIAALDNKVGSLEDQLKFLGQQLAVVIQQLAEAQKAREEDQKARAENQKAIQEMRSKVDEILAAAPQNPQPRLSENGSIIWRNEAAKHSNGNAQQSNVITPEPVNSSTLKQ